VFDSLLHAVSGSPVTYLVIVGVCAGDAVLPLFPSEALVVTAAVAAANGRLNIALVVAAAAAGALLGDNTAYEIGRGGLRRFTSRFESGRGGERLEWAQTQLSRPAGPVIIVVGRFIPGGRTATTVAAGTLEMAWLHRFLPADVIAALLWAGYAAGLGFFGGRAFEDNLWLPLLIAAGVGLLVAGVGELLRRTVLKGGSE
jgi:membrane protein DedA with SNARE-associated domain